MLVLSTHTHGVRVGHRVWVVLAFLLYSLHLETSKLTEMPKSRKVVMQNTMRAAQSIVFFFYISVLLQGKDELKGMSDIESMVIALRANIVKKQVCCQVSLRPLLILL